MDWYASFCVTEYSVKTDYVTSLASGDYEPVLVVKVQVMSNCPVCV